METFISVIETGSLSGAARRLNVDQPAVSKSTGQLVFVCDVFAPIPDVPETLREAAQLSKLVLFVGAGGSKLAACPDWDEFANGALCRARQVQPRTTRLYSRLSKLGRTFVATNYDEWLDDEMPAPPLNVTGDAALWVVSPTELRHPASESAFCHSTPNCRPPT